ncbi:MAG: metallophosphoesterase [Planctomycetaceae bacterium]
MSKQREPLSHYILPVITSLLSLLALVAPAFEGNARSRLGVLLILAALLEMIHGFRRLRLADARSAWKSALISLVLGLTLYSAGWLAVKALRWTLAAWFGMDAVRELISFRKARRQSERGWSSLLLLIAWAAVAITLLWLPEVWLTVLLAGAVAFRLFGISLRMFSSPLMNPQNMASEEITSDLLADPEILTLARTVVQEETSRAAADRSWIIAFLFTLLAIHLGRMGLDRTALGLVAPGFAVMGDIFAGLLVSFLVFIPSLMATNKLLKFVEGGLWRWTVRRGTMMLALPRMILRWLLTMRIRLAVRLRLARCSYAAAISRALQMGLPFAAILAATTPVWGMSWYFDTENWAAGIWNSWAEQRTDTWREAMAEAVAAAVPESDPLPLAIHPEGLSEALEKNEDFSFIIIGDTGEGDASQHSLRAQLLEVANRPEVKFVIISSDVVYPSGAMKDYEARFWLPFMGVRKPVYAIPGNHDWYDALEGFAATFFEPEAARAAMRARVDADNHLTSTTDRHIDQLIAEATRLQSEYLVPVQRQKLPYFQFQTPNFALFAIDTGVARGIDESQRAWLEKALQSASGKFKLALLGHPFYAGGRDVSEGDDDFTELKTLLERYEVDIVMAGDTHDLEYYVEPVTTASGNTKTVRHFVNGGGGAYLSFGTSLDWPAKPVTDEWAIYPSREQVVSKINATAPLWKRPAWFWTRQFGGWPFSAEWLSAAFDSNQAPFYQSFLEIRVETSKNQIRLIPYGVHGPLKKSDFQHSTEFDTGDPANVEWTIEL